MSGLLAARDVSKAFGGVVAVRHASFDVRPGEVHALVGQNGAGKSTLIRILSGALQPDSGQVLYAGRPVHLTSPRVAQDLGIATVYQDPLVYPDLSVVENIFMGRELRDRLGNIDWAAQRQAAACLFADLGIRGTFLTQPIGRLTIGMQQLVLIVKALSHASRVIILDEPTAILTQGETERLFGVIRRLRAGGVGIVYISHRLEEIFQIADRVTVMKDGEVRGTFPVGAISRDRLIDLMAGEIFHERAARDGRRIGEVVLRVEDLVVPPTVKSVSFDVRRGEVLALFGLVGSGRTQVAHALFGIAPAARGRIFLDGEPVAITSPEQALRLGIAYLPEDRKAQGLFLPLPVRYDLTVAILATLRRMLGAVDRRREEAAAATTVRALGIRTPGLHTPTQALSGGNQQKVLLGRWLARRPRLLILDEPTRGVDVAAKEEIHERIFALAAEGVGVVVISSELPEVLKLADRILVLHEGRVTALVARGEVEGEAALLRAATGTREVYANPSA
jgi:ABC-type sugar transport system ATPase subunit